MQATNNEGDGPWSDSGTSSTTGPYFYPISEERVSGVVARSGSEGCKGDDWIWSCLTEPESDGRAAMITLALGAAVRLGFSVESGAVPGTVTGVQFEVTMVASKGTMEPGDYSFTVYAGEEEVANVSGPVAVGTDYTTVSVSSAAITDGLSGNLEDVSIVIQAPSKPHLKLTRVRMVVEYE